jgi:cytochrome d ubiquinol oxidase subunit II
MFEALSYESLQAYWWIIMSFLAGTLVFMLFVQGGQTLINKLSSNEEEKTVLVNLFGHKWETTFTTLVVFGGAFFASFPLFYSTSFGGAYWVWMIILFAFIVQAVSYEYRKKKNNFLGSKTYEKFLFFNGVIAPLFLGVAVSTFFTGSPFSIDKSRIVNLKSNVEAVISQWKSPWHGLEAIWTVENLAFIQNLALGLAIFFLARVLALLYVKKMVDDQSILEKAQKCLKKNIILFLIFFLFWLIRLMFISGFAVHENGEVYMEPYKYFHNLIQQTYLFIMLLVGILLVLWGFYSSLFKNQANAFWKAGVGTLITVMAIFFLAAFNHTAYYPSTYDLQSSLTLANSSSSKYTLVSMAYVSLMVPFVLAYIVWAWRALDNHKISKEELKKEQIKY